MTTATLIPEPTAPSAVSYWARIARDLVDDVDVVETGCGVRRSLAEWRRRFPAGTRIRRVSTGGKWGKSVQIVTL